MLNYQSKPPLLSLKVRRTVNTILAPTDSEASSETNATLGTTKVKGEPPIDHSSELQTISSILEQQCFAFVVFQNQIKNARLHQARILEEFHVRSQEIEKRLSSLSKSLQGRVQVMNKKIDNIERTLSIKPIYRRTMETSNTGRVTGIDVYENDVVCTTSTGNIIRADRETLGIRYAHNIDNKGLFSPKILVRQNIPYVVMTNSNQNLLCGPVSTLECTTITNFPSLSFSIGEGENSHSGFDLVVGGNGVINFGNLTTEKTLGYQSIGTSKKLRGSITAIAVDDHNEAVYAISSKRIFYSISSTTFATISSSTFDKPLMQLFVTECFIILSHAPNEIIIAERNREKFNQIFRFTIDLGLRRFYAGRRALFIITKTQEVHRVKYNKLDTKDIICSSDAADYDNTEYLGVIVACDSDLYLSHGERISLWN